MKITIKGRIGAYEAEIELEDDFMTGSDYPDFRELEHLEIISRGETKKIIRQLLNLPLIGPTLDD